jgi:hypothetical protein
MEYSIQDLSRKFEKSVTKCKFYMADGVSSTGWAYLYDIFSGDDYAHCLVMIYPEMLVKQYWMTCYAKPCNKYPRVEPQYWNPESGLYHVRDGGIAFVKRKVKKSFCVGLNNNPYHIVSFRHGFLGDSLSPKDVDVLRPRVFSDPYMLNKDIYVSASGLYFMGEQIGVKGEDKIMINDPDFISFLPPQYRELCVTNF